MDRATGYLERVNREQPGRSSLMEQIDRIILSDRLSRAKSRFFRESPRICAERVTLATEAWKETQGEHIEVKRAKILKKVLEGIPVVIHDGELTAGSQTKFFRGAYPYVDWDSRYFEHTLNAYKTTAEGKIFGSSLVEQIPEEEIRQIRESADYLRGKTAGEHIRSVIQEMWGDWYKDVVDWHVITTSYESLPYYPGIPFFEEVLAKGLRSIIDEAKQRRRRFLEAMESDSEKLHFWEAAIIACEALISFSKRYAQLAREMSLKEKDTARRHELEGIARMCEWVPENPARTFHEAIQCLRLTHLALFLEQGAVPPSLGRADQYLYPYFKKDIDEKCLTIEQAAELVGDFLSYAGRLEFVPEISFKEKLSSLLFNLTLGGVTKDGDDASNELTAVFLHMLGLSAYASPSTTLRWHPKMSRELMIKGLVTNRKANGIPMYVNDNHVIEWLERQGVTNQDARDWSVFGCSQPVTGPQRHYRSWSISVAFALELALHNGFSPIIGKRIGPETGDPKSFKTFAEVYQAFQQQFEFVCRRVLRGTHVMQRVEGDFWRMPLNSALFPACMEAGRSHIIGGGAGPHLTWYVKDRGIVDVADSLTAIKKLVFEQKKLSMAELLDALDSNFGAEKGEEIRNMCLRAPKYGNDIDEADYMVRDVGKFTAGVISSEKNVFGWPYKVNRHGISWHYGAGKGIGALPNGRKAKEVLNDGSLSPMRGMDEFGPTAVLNSALKADFDECGVAILNQRFPLVGSEGRANLDKIASMTETFLEKGGLHLQFNFLDKQTLLDAKNNPDKYQDLVVRVAGYSAYFVNLPPEVQDEITLRTEQRL